MSTPIQIQIGGNTLKSPIRGYALVDQEDCGLAQMSWCLHKHGYAHGKAGTPKCVLMHRVVMANALGRPLLDSEFVDHINGLRLDNRRANLRLVTKSENSQNRHKPQSNNRTGFRGVTWCNRMHKYVAGVKIHQRRIHCGYFSTAEEAAQAASRKREELGFLTSTQKD